jgi:hypothetical protein
VRGCVSQVWLEREARTSADGQTILHYRGDSDSGLKVRERVGFKRAAVAVARKLAVMMHAMLKTGELFDRSISAAT